MRPSGTALALLLGLAAGTPAPAQGTRHAFEGGYPTPAASAEARADRLLQTALVAYRFWYPTVSMEGIFEGNRRLGLVEGESWGYGAAGPRQVALTLNSDTPYGNGAIDLSEGPWVIEVPPGPFIGLVNDHNQGWVLDIGLPGPDAGQGGKHLILPPDYEGPVPEGYFTGRSNTMKNLFALRALPVGGDVRTALDSFAAVRIYPLSQAADPKPLRGIDTTADAMEASALPWEDNIGFWEQLAKVIDAEPIVPAYLPMYGLLGELGIAKGKPFAPDAAMTALLERAAREGRDQMLVEAFDSDRPDRLAWPDRKWEWAGLVPGGAQFETPAGIDLEARERWFAQAIVTSPAMFRRDPGAGSLYWLGARDATGAWLDGGETYRLSIPQPVPAKLFWSVTVYDAETRSQIRTDQDKAALRSLFELKDLAGTEPADLYFGPEQPEGAEGRWIRTVPGRGWFAYIRVYGPEAAAFDGAWRPGDFERVPG
ncbi:MAG: DUF1254 domain-containing protein [Rhodovulum sulfidophilum]|uniref:DUF1254 domain-containing protein n=1 Tax=Rhodovulum sulfidophilum TaxID=35806 RepID=A0A2W5NJ32_RHOSU|nr:MAG: DUF1254 domain-containing protein [Rhodovulum sulfidophilum]